MKKCRFLIGFVVLGLIGAGCSTQNFSQSELFELKSQCAKLAQEFANNHTDTSRLDPRIIWTIKRHDYNTDRKSCFAEFDKTVSIDSRFLGEYVMYNLLTNEELDTLTYMEDPFPEPKDVEFLKKQLKYWDKDGPKYCKLRREFFGTSDDLYLCEKY